MQRGQDFKLPSRVILGVGEKNHHAEPGAFGLDRADDVGEIGIGDRRNGDPDGAGRGGLQRARDDVRAIVDRVDDRLYRACRRRRNSSRAVDDMRNGRDRNARLPRHVGNRRHLASPGCSLPRPLAQLSFGRQANISKRLRNRFDAPGGAWNWRNSTHTAGPKGCPPTPRKGPNPLLAAKLAKALADPSL